MAKGDGSITKLGPSKYRVQISYGKDPITGKYQRATKVVNGTKVDARKVRDQMRKEREGGLVLDGSKLTFGEFSEEYLRLVEASGEVGQDYIDHLRSRLGFTCSFIGEMRLKDVTPQIIESTLTAIKERKTAERGSFKNASLRNYHEALKLVFQKAVDYDFILRSPCDKVKPIKEEAVERRSLDASEAAKLLALVDACEEEAYARVEGVEVARERLGRTEWPRTRIQFVAMVSFAIGVRIGLATGMRLGEVLGLLWDCVNLEEGLIVIRRSLSRKSGLKEPKTKAGVRTISLDSKTVRHLAKWKREQADILSRIGVEQVDLTPVCCNGLGQLTDAGMFWRQFKRFREEAGFPELKFHELRHTQATLLLGNGTDVKTVQKRLGHARASITLDTYAHALPENDKKAADLIGDLCAVKRGRIIKIKTA